MAESTSASTSNIEVDNGTNKNKICCKVCPSLVLSPKQATLIEKEFFLPFMFKKGAKSQPEDGETLKDYWLVEDMFTFDNVGFSNTVPLEIGNIKYLICADCEIGPIGWHEVSKKKYYIAVDRVRHE